MYKLLIVDDEIIERQALQYIIGNNCTHISKIEEASNGKEAISRASSFMPDIVFMDIKMPGINGIEAARAIKQFIPDCKIVFITAFDYFDYAQEAVKISVEDFIIKPATNEQVIEVINKIVIDLDNENIQRQKQQEVKSKLEQITRYLENELVSSLAAGEIEESQVIEYLSVLGVEVNTGFAAVVNLNFDVASPHISLLQRNMLKKRCMEKLETLLERHNLYCLMSHTNNTILLLLLLKDSRAQAKEFNVIRTMEDISKELSAQLGVAVYAGLGKKFISVREVSNAFSQAKTAYKHCTSKRPVVHYNEVSDVEKGLEYPVKKEKLLCEKLIRCDEREVLLIADEIVGWIIQSFDCFEIVQRKCYDLMVIVSRAVSQELDARDSSLAYSFDDLYEMDTIASIRAYIKDELKKMMSEINNVKLDRAGSLIEKVCEYIKEHYSEDITLDEMASMIGFSSYYFSKIFKNYQNINFIDYLTSIRMEKAKDLLKDPMINIKEISSMVGYSDPNYFTRVFKKTEGITPTEYRDNKVLL